MFETTFCIVEKLLSLNTLGLIESLLCYSSLTDNEILMQHDTLISNEILGFINSFNIIEVTSSSKHISASRNTTNF